MSRSRLDFHIDQDAFAQAVRDLTMYCDQLEELQQKIVGGFEQLRIDWDSDAGDKFFEKLDQNIFRNLKNHQIAFDHISRNLVTASNKYEEVFRAAEAVTNTQL